MFGGPSRARLSREPWGSEVVVMTSPFQVWYSQRKISQLFGNGWRNMVDTFTEIVTGRLAVEDIPLISVFVDRFEFYRVYSGNRRLRVFKELMKYGIIEEIPVVLVRPPENEYDAFWNLATGRSSMPDVIVKGLRHQRHVPIEYKFAVAYVNSTFIRPWITCVAIVYAIFIALLVAREYGFVP